MIRVDCRPGMGPLRPGRHVLRLAFQGAIGLQRTDGIYACSWASEERAAASRSRAGVGSVDTASCCGGRSEPGARRPSLSSSWAFEVPLPPAKKEEEQKQEEQEEEADSMMDCGGTSGHGGCSTEEREDSWYVNLNRHGSLRL